MNTADLVHKELFRKSVEITRLGGLLSEKDAEIAALKAESVTWRQVAESHVSTIHKADAEIAALQARIKELESELSDLKFYLDNLPAHNQQQRIKELEASLQIAEEWRVKERLKNIELEGALSALYEVQNGPPLIEYTEEWNRAIEITKAALKGEK